MDLYTIRNKIIDGTPIQELDLRVTFYARVSTDKYEQLHSLESQISYFRKYINDIPNWKYIDGYIDEGISGTSVNKRENFLRMIDDSKRDTFDLILTKEISRFSRNTLDSIKYTQDLLKNGVGVFFLNDNINTIFSDSELRLTIMASVAQDEVRKLSERVQFGMKRSIEKGVVLGGSNIYGYIKNKGKLIVNEKEAEMIKYIYDTYANTNVSLNKLTNLLYDKGYYNSKNKKICITVLKKVIMNPKYKGYYCGNKSRIIDYRTKYKKILDKDEWLIYKDDKNVPQIVSEELWNKANQKLDNIIKGMKDRIKNKIIFQNRYTYSGRIYCGIHNLTYHRSSSGKRSENPTWECQEYRKHGKNGCNNSKLFECELDKIFKSLFVKIINDSNLKEELIGQYKDIIIKNYSINELDDKKQIEIMNKKNRILDLYISNNLTKQEYVNKNNELNSQLKNIKRNDNFNDEKEYYKLINMLEYRINNDIYVNDIFNVLIEKVFVYKIDNYSKKTKLIIHLFNGEELIGISDNCGKNFHLFDSYTTNNSSKCCNKWRLFI